MMAERPSRTKAIQMLEDDTKEKWQSSRMNVFNKHIKKGLSTTPGKALVFDESHRVLVVVSNALKANHMPHYLINGDVKDPERTKILNAFKDPDSRHRIMLMTSKCGGTGLSGLTVADRVYNMTKFQSPAEEH